MKKMLDELKKLDVDYDVPEGFSKCVMEKIKGDDVKEVAVCEQSKFRYLKKYVIPWASAVAVLVIVVFAGAVGNVRKESIQSDLASDVLMSPSAASSAGASLNESNKAGLNFIFDGLFDGDKASDFLTNESLEMKESLRAENDMSASKSEQSVKTEEVYLTLEAVEILLMINDIESEYDEDSLVVKGVKLHKLKEVLKEVIDEIEITEDKGFGKGKVVIKILK